MKEGAIENTLIDYQLHQKRLVPLLAQALANFFTGEKIREFWTKHPVDILQPGSSQVQEINHALTTYLKAKAGDDCQKALLEVR
jgi:hypothetical protein